MAQRLTCPQGHCTEVSDGNEATAELLRCPVCGMRLESLGGGETETVAPAPALGATMDDRPAPAAPGSAAADTELVTGQELLSLRADKQPFSRLEPRRATSRGGYCRWSGEDLGGGGGTAKLRPVTELRQP